MDEVEIRRKLAGLPVVLFTRNRPSYLEGVVKYWSRWPVKLIAIDGSDQPVDAGSSDAGEARLIRPSETPINGRFSFAAL